MSTSSTNLEVPSSSFDVEGLSRQIPYYLSFDDKKALTTELDNLVKGGTAQFVLDPHNPHYLGGMVQGDGWRGFSMLTESDTKTSVRGLVLSNSCDIDPNNKRDTPSRVVFAPLIKLNKYERILRDNGVDESRISAKITSIKAQHTTNLFYIPRGPAQPEEYIVPLDDVHSMTIAAHLRSQDREKLFMLNMTGFYMLLLKISIHFCRFHENMNRTG